MAGDMDDKCVQKINQLAYTVPKSENRDHQPCHTSRLIHKPSICRIKVKPIRMCNSSEMKKMVPPKICDCGKKTGGGLWGLLFFGLKAAVAAAAVYVSYDLGIWGTIDETQEMYRAFCAAKTDPQMKRYEKWSPPACEAERSLHYSGSFNRYSSCSVSPIDMEKTGIKWRSYWNSGVETVFDAMAGFPQNLINKFKSGYDGKSNLKVEERGCLSINELPEEKKILNKYK